MTELDAKTFDIRAVLAGRSYPEDEVAVYFDEAAGYDIGKNELEIRKLAMLGRVDEHDALETENNELKAKLADSRYVFSLRGVPRKLVKDIEAKALKKYPIEYNLLNNKPLPSDEREEYRENLVWSAVVTKITDPDGAVFGAPGPETIAQIRDYAPHTALVKISDAIVALTEGAKSGFEKAAQDADFLSGASTSASAETPTSSQ